MGLSARSGRARARQGGAWATVALTLAAGAGAVALAGCSSSSSSGPPAYCAARTNLENSIKGLTSLNASSGVSGLKSQVTAIENNASKLVDAAKGDFRLKPDSDVLKSLPGFKQLPLGKMGLFVDELRPTLPVESWTYLLPWAHKGPATRPAAKRAATRPVTSPSDHS